MSLTREDLHTGLHRFATKHDLERFATRQDLASARDETLGELAAVRRDLMVAIEELARMRRVLELIADGITSPSPARSG